MDNKQFLDQVKTLIQVGDIAYLENVLKKNKISSKAAYSKLISTLRDKEDFNIAHQICKSGNLDVYNHFSLMSKDTILNLDFIDANGQNCYHYAVARNHRDFVRYLIRDHQPTLNINYQTNETGESPIFFALGKLKQNQDKIKMVRLLLESGDINPSLLNNDKKACYEAYNDQFGFDEAASIVEKRHLKGDESDQNSLLFMKDFSQAQRNTILDKKVSDAEKVRIVERHIFAQASGDGNFDIEIKDQLKQAQGIQERLKSIQNESSYDPVKYIDPEFVRKELQKKLLEFSGTTLIQNIKNLYN